MTTRQLIEVDVDVIERVAHHYGFDVELTADRAFLRLGDVTFTAPLAAVTA